MVTVFKIENLNKDRDEIANAFKKQKVSEGWFFATPSKFSRYEVFLQYYYYEDLEQQVKKILQDDEDVVSILKNNGKTKVLKRITCFISLLTKTLEIYRGPDKITERIASYIEKILSVRLIPMQMKGEDLIKMYKKHGIELKQVMFKNVDGLMYEILRGSELEINQKFKSRLEKFKNCLRVISFKPNIKYLNGGRYQVTINGDKGTIRFADVDGFKWRPRMEIRQLVFLMAAETGWLN